MEYTEEKQKALAYLASHPLGTLATINDEGKPQLSTIYIFVEPDFTVYFLTKTESRKFQNILKRKDVNLLCASEEMLLSIEFEGEVQQVVDTVGVVQVTDRFRKMIETRKGNYWTPPVAQLQSGQYVACKLIPTSVHIHLFADESNGIEGARHVTLCTSDLTGVL